MPAALRGRGCRPARDPGDSLRERGLLTGRETDALKNVRRPSTTNRGRPNEKDSACRHDPRCLCLCRLRGERSGLRPDRHQPLLRAFRRRHFRRGFEELLHDGKRRTVRLPLRSPRFGRPRERHEGELRPRIGL